MVLKITVAMLAAAAAPPATAGAPASTLSVMRIELQPDGTVASCTIQVGTLPEARPVASQACPAEPPPPPIAELFRQRAPVYRTLRLVGVTARKGQEVPASMRSGWGDRLSAQVSDIDVDAAGRPLRCTSVEAQALVAGMPAHCAAVGARIAEGGAKGPPAATLRVENSLYGIRR